MHLAAYLGGTIEEPYDDDELYEELVEDEQGEEEEGQQVAGPWAVGTTVWAMRPREFWWPAEVRDRTHPFLSFLLFSWQIVRCYALSSFSTYYGSICLCLRTSSQITGYTLPEGAGVTECIVDFFGKNRVRCAPLPPPLPLTFINVGGMH